MLARFSVAIGTCVHSGAAITRGCSPILRALSRIIPSAFHVDSLLNQKWSLARKEQ